MAEVVPCYKAHGWRLWYPTHAQKARMNGAPCLVVVRAKSRSKNSRRSFDCGRHAAFAQDDILLFTLRVEV